RLLDLTADAARELLERLVDAQLLESPCPGRYRFHDLVRLFARERAAAVVAEPARVAALTRTFGFYAATAWESAAALRPDARRLALAGPDWTNGGFGIGGPAAEVLWLEEERGNLLAAVDQAARLARPGPSGEPALAPALRDVPGQLALALFGFFLTRGH